MARSRLFYGILIALAVARAAGEQHVRLGSLALPPLHWSALLVVLLCATFLIRPSFRRMGARVLWGAALVLAVAAQPLFVARANLVGSSTPWTARVHRLSEGPDTEAKVVAVASFRQENRRMLNRLAGRRRDVLIEGSFFLQAPTAGSYVFTALCDDYCSLAIDGNEVLVSTGAMTRSTLALDEGIHPASVRYEQSGGPAYFVLDWDRPDFLELLSLEHHVAPGADALSPSALERKELLAALAWAGTSLWWVAALSLLSRVFTHRTEVLEVLRRPRVETWVTASTAAVLILYGALMRWDALLVRAHQVKEGSLAEKFHESLVPWFPDYGSFYPELQPETPYRADVAGYLELASRQTLGSFYDASRREPFYVLLVRIFVTLSGGNPVGILVQSFFFSVAALILAFVVARRFGGPYVALPIVAALVLHEYLVLEAPSGYRDTAYGFFLLAFTVWVGMSSDRPSALRAVAAGLLGSAVCLIRLSGLSVVLPLVGYVAWKARARGGFRFLGAALLTLLAVTGPFLWSCYRAHGDPFYAVSVHGRFWLEKEALAEGKAPGLSEYLFGYHSLGELASGHLRGLTWLPLRTFWRGLAHFPLLDAAAIAFGALGLLACLRGGSFFWVIAYFGHLLPFAYIQNFPSGEMPRFVMPAYFFLVLSAGALARRAPGDRSS